MNIIAVVVTYNRIELLKRTVRCLQQNKPVSSIVVVNNGSTDATAEWLKTQSGLTVINQANVGAPVVFTPVCSMHIRQVRIGFGAWMMMFFRVPIVWNGYCSMPVGKI